MITQKFFTLLDIVKREYQRISAKRTLYYIIIYLPIILFLYYPYIYYNGVVRELPVTMLDLDKSELSRTAIQLFKSSPDFSFQYSPNSLSEVNQLFRKGEIFAAFIIPKNFEKEIKSNRNTRITVLNNCTNLITGNIVLKDATQIIKTISGGILLKKIKSAGNYPTDKAISIVNPIKIETKTLFNPNYNYMQYLATGLILSALQMIIMISSCLIINSEIKHNTLTELISISKGSSSLVILGKSLAHLSVHLCTILLILFIIFPLFRIHQQGNTLNSLLILTAFIFASFSTGIMVSSLVKDQQFATEIIIFINTPAFIFSGAIYPLSAMPELHSIFAQIIPFTHFLYGFIKLNQMNSSLLTSFNELLILNGFGLLFIMVANISLNKVIKSQRV